MKKYIVGIIISILLTSCYSNTSIDSFPAHVIIGANDDPVFNCTNVTLKKISGDKNIIVASVNTDDYKFRSYMIGDTIK